MKRNTIVVLFMALAILLSVFFVSNTAMADNDEIPVGDDWVSIVSLTPNHYENYSDPITFTATINYQLSSKEQGIVYLGFNTDQPHYYEVDVQEGDHQVVSKGVGTVTLTQTVTPVDWDSGYSYMQQFLDGNTSLVKDFMVYANISEYPHDIPWTPLAIDEAVVTELPEKIVSVDILYGNPTAPDRVQFDTSLDEMLLDKDFSKYDPQLAHLLIALCNSVHNSETMVKSFENMGFTSWKVDYKWGDSFSLTQEGIDSLNNDPWLAYGFARKKLSDGSELVLVVTRGTDGLIEAISNFDAIDSIFGAKRHKGFNDAATTLRTQLAEFLGTDDYSNMIFVLTGHSRGAAATNLMAADMIETGIPNDRIVAYNFACPDAEKMTKSRAESPQYSSIFNISNANDIISWVPSTVFENGTRVEGEAYWDKFGYSYWFADDWDDENGLLPKFDINIGGRMGEYHLQNTYLEYLSKEKTLDEYKNREDTTDCINDATEKRKKAAEDKRKAEAEEDYKNFEDEYRIDRVSVFCPVDVEIMDDSGARLAYTHDDVGFIEKDGQDKIAIFIENDRKCILLKNMDAYKLAVTGRSEGTMLFQVQSSDDGANYEEPVQSFENVQISAGKSFKWDKDTKLLLVDSQDDTKVLAEIQPDGAELMFEEESEKEEKSVDTKSEVIDATSDDTQDMQLFASEPKKNSVLPVIMVILIILAGGAIGIALFLRKETKKTRYNSDEKSDKKYCVYCGKRLLDNAEFCSYCGKKQ